MLAASTGISLYVKASSASDGAFLLISERLKLLATQNKSFFAGTVEGCFSPLALGKPK
jgi:hypothetical protein